MEAAAEYEGINLYALAAEQAQVIEMQLGHPRAQVLLEPSGGGLSCGPVPVQPEVGAHSGG